jgi:hypothetical protein
MLGYDDDLWGGSWISEATLGGVQNRPAERSMHNIVAVFTCKFDATLAIRDLREHVGDHFDYPGLVLFYWPKVIWRLFHRKIKKPWRSTSSEFCSEYVALFLLAAVRLGLVPRLDGLHNDPEKNSPESLLQVLEHHPAYFEKAVA